MVTLSVNYGHNVTYSGDTATCGELIYSYPAGYAEAGLDNIVGNTLFTFDETDDIIDISKSFGVDAKKIGYVEKYSKKKLTIYSENEVLQY